MLFTIFNAILFILLGSFVVFLNDDRHNENYYQNYLHKVNHSVLKIEKVLKPSLYQYKYEAEVIQVNQHKTIGKILININKDSLKTDLKIGDEILINTNFSEIKKPLNPHQFNYKKYLERQGIYQQVFLSQWEFKKQKEPRRALFGIAQNIRENLQESLRKHQFSEDEFGVLSALLLGQRQDVAKELSEDYANAGVIHILAVSGLHVGIILLIFLRLFKPIAHVKYGKVGSAIFIILILWFFAFLAGLSASVVRAVTMYTFITFGAVFKSKKIIEFSLVSSAFFLLLIKPMFLFDVGFQLSYLAVFGIIWVQPVIYNFLKTRWKLSNYFMQLISVSCAAQLAVFPLSLFYFHQFPGLFLLSNIVIIPFLSALLLGGILIIILSVSGILPDFIANFYGAILSTLNSFISFVAKQEAFLFQDISMSFLFMLASYLLIIMLFQWVRKRTIKPVIYLLIAFVIFQTIWIFEKHERNYQKSFIVFHQNRSSLFGKRVGKNLVVFSHLDSLPSMITNYEVGENVHIIKQNEVPNYFTVAGNKILLVDSLGVYKVKHLQNCIVLLRDSPKINLNRLINTLNPKQIIADGSNYKSYVANWKLICEKNNIKFKNTSEDGAVILD